MHNPFSAMYVHRLKLYRWSEITDGYITKNSKSVICSGVPCRYSAGGKTARGTKDPSLVSSHIVFVGCDTDIKAGDDAEVTLQDGSVIYLKIGEVHPYTYEYQADAERQEHA